MTESPRARPTDGLPLLGIFAIWVLVIGCAGEQPAPGTQSAIVTATATSTPSPSPSRSAPTNPAEEAIRTIHEYEDAIIDEDFDAAWDLLSPFAQGFINRQEFEATLPSLIETIGVEYEVGQPDPTWSNLIPSFTEGEREDIAAQADRSLSFGIVVEFVNSESADLGRQDFVVAFTRAGEWRIWPVH